MIVIDINIFYSAFQASPLEITLHRIYTRKSTEFEKHITRRSRTIKTLGRRSWIQIETNKLNNQNRMKNQVIFVV